MQLIRLIVRPVGHLLFLVAVAALSAASFVLGEVNDLGFFAGRLSRSVQRYPEVTRRGRETAWVLWAIVLALALSPLDPLATPWDEVAVAAVGALALWRHFADGSRAER